VKVRAIIKLIENDGVEHVATRGCLNPRLAGLKMGSWAAPVGYW